MPSGRSRYNLELALRKLLNTTSVLNSFEAFDFVTKPKKVSYLVGWVNRSQISFESRLSNGWVAARKIKKREDWYLAPTRAPFLPYLFVLHVSPQLIESLEEARSKVEFESGILL